MQISTFIASFLGALLLGACAGPSDFEKLSPECSSGITPNISFADLEAWFAGETVRIQQDWVLEGYVVSSDRAGNFFNILHIQNHPVAPTRGLQLELELRNAHLFFETGSKVLIKLRGLYLGKSRQTLKLGGTFTGFGNLLIGQLPALNIHEHLLLSCDALIIPQPTPVTLPTLDTLLLNTLVRFENLQVSETEVGQPFAVAREETERTLMDCQENNIVLLNSGYADFQAEPLPAGMGTVTGILLQDGNDFQLAIRSLEDIHFNDEPCSEIIPEFTSTKIFISELADPDNNTEARFVELYNAAPEPLDLNHWTLRRYTNESPTVSSTINLSGLSIGAQSTLVIAPNASEFESVYGFAPHLDASANGPADSNGDDNLELVDPFGTVTDRFGVIGEDGAGTNHEFTDGRAMRKAHITEANPMYTVDEWTITSPVSTSDENGFTPGQKE